MLCACIRVSSPSFTVILTPPFVSVCPQALQSVTFTCTADLGAILWIQGSHQQYYSSSSTVNDTGSLGAFTVRLVSVDGSNYASTATVTNTSELLSITGNITLTCDDNGDAVGGATAVLVLNGNFYCYKVYNTLLLKLLALDKLNAIIFCDVMTIVT